MRRRHFLLSALSACAAAPAGATGLVLGPGAWLSIGNGDRVEGSGHVAQDTRATGAFHALKLAGPVDVELKAGQREQVTVSADNNLLPFVETVVRDGTLAIGLRRGAALRTRNRLLVTIEFTSLDAIATSGSGDVRVSELKTRELNVAIAGSSDVAIERLDADILAVSIAGSGDLRASGRARTQAFSITGSGEVNAADLAGETVAVKIAGSGDAKVHATKALTVSIAGSGAVAYRGQPQVTKSIMGSGEVAPLR